MTVNLLGIAGMASKTTVAPLDRVKILLQAKHHQYVHQGILLFAKNNCNHWYQVMVFYFRRSIFWSKENRGT